ncbi:MAG TPA: type I methionyl aminopeptidase [Candidatus Glassbacteria bacterium]|nr:type I methionyl aminopeptidase [Candidatus Glassbacteria bacterium]
MEAWWQESIIMDYMHHICSLKDEEWLENQIHAGKVLAKAIKEAIKSVSVGATTKEIDDVCENVILDHEGCTPTFKGFTGFPCATVISLNEEVVHGIPNKERRICGGDIITVDAGVTYNGAIADMARTFSIGYISSEFELLIKTCEECFHAAVRAIEKADKPRLGDIGYAISREAKKIGANVIVDYGGHGIEKNKPHAHPFVYNYGERGKGPILYSPGTVICIEPMLTFGPATTNIKDDGWTVCTKETSVHYENTIFIGENNKVTHITDI